ncbi:MAG: glycosyltransferase [Lachnospiraceae bacterium]|nr:glycosyltransferase [Lachnospiraceae bacterium]
MSEPIRVLHVLGGVSLGGAESRIMDLYRQTDRSRLQFDFLIHTTEPGYFEDEILSLGGKIYRLPRFKGWNLIQYLEAVNRFFEAHHEFVAVHGHMTSTASLYLPIAKKYGIPLTIAHARSAGTDPGIKGMITKFLRKSLYKKADTLLSCSTEAAIAVYGKKSVDNHMVQILPNAIVTKDFAYDPEMREQMRDKLGISDRFVVGHVGRFHYAKNHEFLVSIFKSIALKRPDAILLLMGEGPLLSEIKEKIQLEGLSNSVIFTGNQRNVSDYYMAMDYLVFPSRFEGLPGTIVEAQSSGLQCLMSDTVTPEVMITDCVKRLSLDETAGKWAEEVLKDTDHVRMDRSREVAQAGFDAKAQVEWLFQFYNKDTYSAPEKILLMVPMLHQGGFEKVCVRTARLLTESDSNVEVKILIFNDEDIAYDTAGLEVINLDVKSSPGKFGKIINVIRRVRKVRAFKKQYRNHITYSFGITANLINVLSREQDQIWAGIRGFTDLYSKTLSLFCKRADLIVCCSKAIETIIKEKYQESKTTTIYNPYDVNQMELLAQEELPEEIQQALSGKKVIISMGREDEVKGFWHLIKSFHQVLQTEPDALLVIIGEGTYLPYKQLAHDLGIESKVLFTGVLMNPFPLLSKAAVYVLTSLHEGFPNALVEAMALSVPVIATNCLSGPAEILGNDPQDYHDQSRVYEAEYGILVPILKEEPDFKPDIYNEEQTIAEYICKIIQNDKYARYYAHQGRNRAISFSDSAYLEQLYKMMRVVTKQGDRYEEK